jgi:hypothetical protein
VGRAGVLTTPNAERPILDAIQLDVAQAHIETLTNRSGFRLRADASYSGKGETIKRRCSRIGAF